VGGKPCFEKGLFEEAVSMKSVLYILALVGACVFAGYLYLEKPELVMPPGCIIEAVNKQGKMRIEAVGKYTRKYKWKGRSKKFRLWPREKRWNGSKGAYRPSGDRDMHAVLEEGQQHFSSQEEVYPWLIWQRYNGRRDVKYTSDGLVVVWQEQRHPVAANYSALSVDVWQIYVDGKKPSGLRGASDGAIKVLQQGSAEIVIGKPSINTARTINGRKYSGKALDFMDEDRISVDRVEKVLSKAEPRREGEYTCYTGLWLEDKALEFAVWVNSDGIVVYVN